MRAAVLVRMGVPPNWGEDWPTYAPVAQNILRGCGVSLSDPAGTACVPHFGGNGLPGYPAFIALVRLLFGPSDAAMAWAQAAVASLAPARLAYGAWRLSGPRIGLAAGLVAAVSPWAAEWAREGMTEALTIACATWWLAEVALSVAARRLRVLAVAAPLVVGIFLRLDFALFIVPTALAGLWLHGLRGALLRGATLALLLALPLGLWEARNLAVGVSPLPPARAWMLPNGAIGPLGYKRWLKSWVRTEEQRALAMRFANDRYDVITIPFSATRDDAERARITALMQELSAQSGHPFPPDVDAGFAKLAAEREREQSWPDLLRLRAAQVGALWRLWTTPIPGGLLPFPEGSAPLLVGNVRFQYRIHNDVGVSGFAVSVWRFALGILFLGALGIAAIARGSPVRLFVLMAASLVLGKTLLSVAGMFLEARYTATLMPSMEFAVVLAAAWLWQAVRRRRVPIRVKETTPDGR